MCIFAGVNLTMAFAQSVTVETV